MHVGARSASNNFNLHSLVPARAAHQKCGIWLCWRTQRSDNCEFAFLDARSAATFLIFFLARAAQCKENFELAFLDKRRKIRKIIQTLKMFKLSYFAGKNEKKLQTACGRLWADFLFSYIWAGVYLTLPVEYSEFNSKYSPCITCMACKLRQAKAVE